MIRENLDQSRQTVKEKEGKGRVTVAGLLVNYDPRELDFSDGNREGG
jgi:hypothetical protein